MIEKWPSNVWGYVALADAHSHFFGDELLPLDLERAEHYLRRGLALADPEDRDRDLLEDRLSELRKQPAPIPAPTPA